MTSLAFDTSNGICSVGLCIPYSFGKEKVESVISTEPNQQTRFLMGYIDQLLTKHSIVIEDIDNIIVTCGPGSFTGVRIGISAALGFKLATSINILNINSLAAMAVDHKLNHHNNCDIIVLWRATTYDVYYQYFSSELKILSPPTLMKIDQINREMFKENSVIIGNFYIQEEQSYKGIPQYLIESINMANIALAVEKKLYSHLFSDILEPIYLRPAI